MQIFDTEITSDQSARLTYIELPFNAKDVFNKPKGTIFVTGTINGIPYRNRLLSRGGGKQIMIIDKPFQKSIGFTGEKMSAQITMSIDDMDAQENTRDKIDAQDSISANLSIVTSSNTDVLTAISTRRSIRKFTSEPITEDMLNTILHAGMCAPSAKNKRPYHFIVIKSKETLSELSSNNSNVHMLCTAACAVVVCGDRNREGIKEFLYEDCAAVTQNMLLCIHGLGLGGVWCGITANSELYKLIIERLKLPLKIEPVTLIALGHSVESKTPNEIWDAGKLHYETW